MEKFKVEGAKDVLIGSVKNFFKNTVEMFKDFARIYAEYKEQTPQKQKRIRRKALWFLGYTLVHAITTAIFAFIAILAMAILIGSGDMLTDVQRMCILLISIGCMVAMYFEILCFEWPAIEKASRKRNARIKAKRIKKQLLKACK